MRENTKTALFYQVLTCALGILALELPTFAIETSSRLQLLNLGVTERLTTQASSGVNLSTMLTWNPHYRLNRWLNLEGLLGATLMSSTNGLVYAGRYQIGTSFHHLFSNEDRIVPEILVGAETWGISPGGGTFFAASGNIHYRFLFSNLGILNLLDSVHVGYHWLPNNPVKGQQFSVGIRIAIFPEKTQPSKPIAKAEKNSRAIAATPTNTTSPLVKPQDIAKKKPKVGQ